MRFMVKTTATSPMPSTVQKTDVLPSAAFSYQGPDTLTNGSADFVPVAKRRRFQNPVKSAAPLAKRRKDPAISARNIEYSDFLNYTQTHLRLISGFHLRKLSELETEITGLPAEHIRVEENTTGLPLYVVAKKLSVLQQRRISVQKKIENLRNSETISALREVIIQYITRYNKCQSAEERADVVEDFKGRYGSGEDTAPVHRCNVMVCPTCDIPMNIRSDDGFLLCVQCNTTQVHSERPIFVGPNGGGDDADLHVVANKRENNFRDYLHLLQGKKLNPQLEAKMPIIVQSLVVPPPGTGLRDTKAVDSITEGLSAIGLRKFAKYLVLIEARLRGLSVVQIPLQIENRMCAMFLTIVDPYERNKPAYRKHFISYAYCAWQFCRIENWTQFFPLFRLLKDEKKIVQQDLIFQPICFEVGWKFESPLRYRYSA
jgi:Poxvirus Late Transcription Factor VLTF3 like